MEVLAGHAGGAGGLRRLNIEGNAFDHELGGVEEGGVALIPLSWRRQPDGWIVPVCDITEFLGRTG
jgi:hypothetical protein